MRLSFNGVFGEITSLPGCSQIGVSHAVFSPVPGKGKQAHTERLEHMKEVLGYDYSLCTVDASNLRQKNILNYNHWEHLSSFTSTKTKHTVEIWGKSL